MTSWIFGGALCAPNLDCEILYACKLLRRINTFAGPYESHVSIKALGATKITCSIDVVCWVHSVSLNFALFGLSCLDHPCLMLLEKYTVGLLFCLNVNQLPAQSTRFSSDHLIHQLTQVQIESNLHLLRGCAWQGTIAYVRHFGFLTSWSVISNLKLTWLVLGEVPAFLQLALIG